MNYLGTTQDEEYVGALMNLWEAESEEKNTASMITSILFLDSDSIM